MRYLLEAETAEWRGAVLRSGGHAVCGLTAMKGEGGGSEHCGAGCCEVVAGERRVVHGLLLVEPGCSNSTGGILPGAQGDGGRAGAGRWPYGAMRRYVRCLLMKPF